MSTSDRLYQRVPDVIRAHTGGEDCIDAINAEVLDEVESLAADRADEILDQSRILDSYDPAVAGRIGHTEVEAAQRWCPFAREATPVGKGKKDVAIGNRYFTDKDDYTNPAGCRCIASHCMSWRWESETRGRCGLAGPMMLIPTNEPRHLRNRMPPARETIPDLFDDVAVADGCRGGDDSTP